MRVSVDPQDPGYKVDPELRKVKVTLDGVEQKLCITADEELGYVKVHDLAEDGTAKTKKDSWLYKELYGVVKIIKHDAIPT